MLEDKKSASNRAIGLGLVLSLLAFGLIAAAGQSLLMILVSLLAALAGIFFFTWGCWQYAQAKGYPGAVGFLGLIGLLGLIALALLPDRHPEHKLTAALAYAGPGDPFWSGNAAPHVDSTAAYAAPSTDSTDYAFQGDYGEPAARPLPTAYRAPVQHPLFVPDTANHWSVKALRQN